MEDELASSQSGPGGVQGGVGALLIEEMEAGKTRSWASRP